MNCTVLYMTSPSSKSYPKKVSKQHRCSTSQQQIFSILAENKWDVMILYFCNETMVYHLSHSTACSGIVQRVLILNKYSR